MSFVKLAWVTSYLSFALALSQSWFESPLAFASASQPELDALPSDRRAASTKRQRGSALLATETNAARRLAQADPTTVEPPLQLGFARDQRTDSLSATGLSSLSTQAAAWQSSLGNAFCRSTPPFLVDWADAPDAPALPGREFAKLNLTQRFAQAVESLFHWSDLSVPRSPHQLEVAVTTSPNATLAAPDKMELNFWTVLRQPAQIFQPPASEEPEQFYIVVNEQTIGRLDNEQQAELIAERLESLLSDRHFEPQTLQPSLIGGKPAGQAGDRVLFAIDESVSPDRDQNRELMAIKWVNNLRLAFDLAPLELVEAQEMMYGIAETTDEFHGTASWYGPYFHGRLTANGETYDQEAFTAAHPSLPFDTYLKVTNLETEETVIVRINDRGPYIPPRTLDLSRGVARCLNSKDAGVVPYRAVIMEPYTAAARRTENNI